MKILYCPLRPFRDC